jgi:hypothetical protein
MLCGSCGTLNGFGIICALNTRHSNSWHCKSINNPDFNVLEFHNIRNEVGSNGFILSSSMWITRTCATGIKSSPGRYGGTFAHKDIAFEFGTWLSPEFKLYLIKEF